MHLFELGKTYFTTTLEDGQVPGYPKGVTTLAYADQMALQQEFMYSERPHLDPANGNRLTIRHMVAITPTTAQLRRMVDESPDMFADLPGTVDPTVGEMSDGLREYLHKFTRWFDSKRRK